MASNPCLTFLLLNSAIITISLIITSALLATNHGCRLVCGGNGVLATPNLQFLSGWVVEEDKCRSFCNLLKVGGNSLQVVASTRLLLTRVLSLNLSLGRVDYGGDKMVLKQNLCLSVEQ